MRVPQIANYGRLSRWLGVFLLGAIIGGWVLLGMVHRSLDVMLTENNSLKKEVKQLHEDYEQLKSQRIKKTTIAHIRVHFEDPAEQDEPLDEITKNDLEQKILKSLRIFIGKSPNTLASPEIYRGLINWFYPNVGEKDYNIKLTMVMVLQSELHIWVKANEFKREKLGSG